MATTLSAYLQIQTAAAGDVHADGPWKRELLSLRWDALNARFRGPSRQSGQPRTDLLSLPEERRHFQRNNWDVQSRLPCTCSWETTPGDGPDLKGTSPVLQSSSLEA
ncbi:Hypothetical predicted protein [Podarcis lilfordi]|uniref:Uncharacterized protein n=1 Tax=Podarcis lilfordi TaxID=74358 RepID=A0AA35PNQ9_9SAUR|nr:Hypothetical predicted protein [Podarcis lilfordi]